MLAYKRTQILLDPEQHAELTNVAAEEKRSLSDIIREGMANYLAARAAERKRKKALESIEWLDNFRRELASKVKQPLPDPVDVLNEAREERMTDFERIWRGEE